MKNWKVLLVYLVLVLALTLLHFTHGCDNLLQLNECIDPGVYDKKWEQLNEEKCGSQSDAVLHCQNDGSIICSMCEKPITCGPGTYAFIDTSLGRVECVPCGAGMYQDHSKTSHFFRQPNCDANHNSCGSKKTQCSEGTATQDIKCRCNHKAGYRPSSTSSACECFDYHSTCNCEEVTCPGGVKLNSTYHCLPPPPPSTTAATTPAYIVRLTIEVRNEPDPVLIAGIVGGAVGLIIIVVLIWYCRRKRRSNSESLVLNRNSPEDPQDLSNPEKSSSATNGAVNNSSNHETKEKPKEKSRVVNGEIQSKSPVQAVSPESEDVPELALPQNDSDLVRQRAQQKAEREKLKTALKEKPSSYTFHIKDSTVNAGENPVQYVMRGPPLPHVDDNDIESDVGDDVRSNDPGSDVSPSHTPIRRSREGSRHPDIPSASLREDGDDQCEKTPLLVDLPPVKDRSADSDQTAVKTV